MKKNVDYVRLVERAQLGDKQCLDRLTKLAEERLREDVGRITLNHDLTQDIVQEALLEMFKKLRELKATDRFWNWLTKIAINKVSHHYRKEKRLKTALSCPVGDRDGQENSQDVVAELVSKEFQQIVLTAMRRLKPQHRTVLTLRCYRDMEYAQIAEVMGRSEFATTMLFYRAKKALGRQLSRHGYGKSLLLPALVLFGKMTVSSEAAAANISVTAATTKVGLLAGLAGMATSKSAVVTLTTAGVLAVGSIVITSGPEKTTVQTGQKPVTNSHIVSPIGPAQNDSEEHWYYFPEGPDKPMMMQLKSNTGSKQSQCQLLQNDRANYYYHENNIYINNYRMTTSDLSVFRLPTDSPQLSRFLSKVEGQTEQIEYVPNKNRGLLVIATHNSSKGSNHSWAIRHYNVLDEDYFQSDWPTGVRTIDNRDMMHKRGWTYFRVTGQINGENVYGVGRIPFVYATSRRYSPWLKLRIGGSLRIADSGTDACVYDGSGKVTTRYEGGSFFKGLGRPWMGLHTVDTVRRDAAEQLIWFETELGPGSSKVQVILTCEQVKLIYTIDLKTDVIDEMTFSAQENIKGQLRFSYLQNIDSVGNEFARPTRQSSQKRQQKSKGLLWLVQLAEDSLGK
jgi:RNA polymerase sigma-70 factor (ECF subfamily)